MFRCIYKYNDYYINYCYKDIVNYIILQYILINNYMVDSVVCFDSVRSGLIKNNHLCYLNLYPLYSLYYKSMSTVIADTYNKSDFIKLDHVSQYFNKNKPLIESTIFYIHFFKNIYFVLIFWTPWYLDIPSCNCISCIFVYIMMFTCGDVGKNQNSLPYLPQRAPSGLIKSVIHFHYR